MYENEKFVWKRESDCVDLEMTSSVALNENRSNVSFEKLYQKLLLLHTTKEIVLIAIPIFGVFLLVAGAVLCDKGSNQNLVNTGTALSVSGVFLCGGLLTLLDRVQWNGRRKERYRGMWMDIKNRIKYL